MRFWELSTLADCVRSCLSNFFIMAVSGFFYITFITFFFFIKYDILMQCGNSFLVQTSNICHCQSIFLSVNDLTLWVSWCVVVLVAAVFRCHKKEQRSVIMSLMLKGSTRPWNHHIHIMRPICEWSTEQLVEICDISRCHQIFM